MSFIRLFTKNKKDTKKKILCKYRTEVELDHAKIIFDCKGCARAGNLNDIRCIREALAAITKEYNVDLIIFSDYIETKYTGAAIEVLKQIATILNEVDRFSLRKPWEERLSSAGFNRATQKKICANCNINPSLIFSRMRKEGVRSLENIFKTYNSYISNIYNCKKRRSCRGCIETTKGDLLYAQKLLENLRAFVLYQAYKVVEDKR